ncbi:peptidase M76 family-domain-containing protein [Mycena filopes]|nr:peptidase M76 family-domain-containing protein [Mycena filopes]KAJ7175463.1 peptidase M76 family-domain-containing protein [Mycena filopes]
MSTPPPTPPKLSSFERWRRNAMLATGLGVSEDERLEYLLEQGRLSCEQKKLQFMERSPAVVFMLKHLQAAGCDLPPSNVICGPCDRRSAGGFNPKNGAIVLCQGVFFGDAHMENIMVHEMIHLFDHCRFKVDWLNLRHHACSEIRANSLSGDCRWSRELRIGSLAFTKHHQDCVRRRAVTSVSRNLMCPDKATAERVVNEVFESCFKDTRPFDEIY